MKNDLRFLGLQRAEGDAEHVAVLQVASPAGRVREISLTESEALALIRRAAQALERRRWAR